MLSNFSRFIPGFSSRDCVIVGRERYPYHLLGDNTLRLRILVHAALFMLAIEDVPDDL